MKDQEEEAIDRWLEAINKKGFLPRTLSKLLLLLLLTLLQQSPSRRAVHIPPIASIVSDNYVYSRQQ